MAGKKQGISLQSTLFTDIPIQRPTIDNWTKSVIPHMEKLSGTIIDIINEDGVNYLADCRIGFGCANKLTYDADVFAIHAAMRNNRLLFQNAPDSIDNPSLVIVKCQQGHMQLGRHKSQMPSLDSTILDAVKEGGEWSIANRAVMIYLAIGCSVYTKLYDGQVVRHPFASINRYATPAALVLFCKLHGITVNAN